MLPWSTYLALPGCLLGKGFRQHNCRSAVPVAFTLNLRSGTNGRGMFASRVLI